MVSNTPAHTNPYIPVSSPQSRFKPMKSLQDIAGKGVLVIEQKSKVHVPFSGVEVPEVMHATAFELVRHDSRLTLSDDTYVQLIMGAGLRIKVKQKGINKKVQNWSERIKLEEKIEDGLHSLIQCGSMMFEREKGASQIVEIDMATMISAVRNTDGEVKKYLQDADGMGAINALDPETISHFKLTNTRREVWGRGLFHSLFAVRNVGEDEISPIVANWKMQSDMVKIFDSYASPIMMIHFKDAGEQWIKKYETELKKMKAGTKIITDKEFDAKVFEVNGAAKFAEYVNHLEKNVIEPGTQFPLAFFTDGFSSSNVAEVSESTFGKKVKRIQKKVAKQIKRDFVMKYIKVIAPAVSTDDVTVAFEIESKSEIGNDQVLLYFEKGVITRSEARNHLVKKSTIEMDETDMENTPPITSTTPTNDMRTTQPSPAAAGKTADVQQADIAKLQQTMSEMKLIMEEKIPKPRGRPKAGLPT